MGSISLFLAQANETNHKQPLGGLAQLVERLLRKQEVTGSTPVISTRKRQISTGICRFQLSAPIGA